MNIDGLTPAQQEVLRLAPSGLSEATIADRLGRSWHTVHTHVKAIFKRLEVHSRTELLAKLLAGKYSARLRIDGIVALIMGLERATSYLESVYNTRGALFITLDDNWDEAE